MDIKSIQLSQLTQLKGFATKFSNLEEDYILSRISYDNNLQKNYSSDKPIRINGLTMILCLDGNFSLDINIDHYEITSNTILVAGPNSIIRFSDVKEGTIDAYTLFVSVEFLKDINLDINLIKYPSSRAERSPILKLTDEETKLLRKHLELILLNTTDNTSSVYVKNIARNLMASMIYQMMQFSENHREEIEKEEEAMQPQSRRMNYVLDFMGLVQKHHCRERTVGFYADKLFISPKYLSLIIKESTGKSAAEWIDEYVILEAKNLLRFSGKNIQQVAYELNFTNQSSFGKYFKHLTGMSPSEFQRS